MLINDMRKFSQFFFIQNVQPPLLVTLIYGIMALYDVINVR